MWIWTYKFGWPLVNLRPKVAFKATFGQKSMRKGQICRRQIWPFFGRKIFSFFSAFARSFSGKMTGKWKRSQKFENFKFSNFTGVWNFGQFFFDRKFLKTSLQSATKSLPQWTRVKGEWCPWLRASFLPIKKGDFCNFFSVLIIFSICSKFFSVFPVFADFGLTILVGDARRLVDAGRLVFSLKSAIGLPRVHCGRFFGQNQPKIDRFFRFWLEIRRWSEVFSVGKNFRLKKFLF